MLSRPKDHLGRGPGIFLAIKPIALLNSGWQERRLERREGPFRSLDLMVDAGQRETFESRVCCTV